MQVVSELQDLPSLCSLKLLYGGRKQGQKKRKDRILSLREINSVSFNRLSHLVWILKRIPLYNPNEPIRLVNKNENNPEQMSQNS